MQRLPIGIVSLVAVWVAGAASAATIVVKPGGAFPTIQSGITAAAAGDTVLVKAGVYTETPTISAAKTGLVVRGVGKVIVDARDANGVADGAGFTVNAADVTIENLTIRHAAPDLTAGYGVFVVANGVELRKLAIVGCGDAGIRALANDVVVSKCAFRQNLVGVDIQGSGARVEQCSFDNMFDDGIVIDGDQAILRKNAVRRCGGSGIQIAGLDAIVEQNTITSVGTTGILAVGNSHGFKKNVISGANNGFVTDGTGANFEMNKVRDCLGGGIDATGTSTFVFKNRVERVGLEGILVAGTSSNFQLNVLIRCGSGGIRVVGLSAFFDKNVVLDCCKGAIGAGISVVGNSASLHANVVKRCADGFRIDGNSAFLDFNQAIDNARDGFDVVMGTNAHLEKNVAKKNAAEGIDNEGSSTSLEKNVCVGNRIDVATAIPFTSFTANTFATGGASTLPQID